MDYKAMLDEQQVQLNLVQPGGMKSGSKSANFRGKYMPLGNDA